jgi:hypothetical protein
MGWRSIFGSRREPKPADVAEAEVHRLGHRLFATGAWGHGPGAAVPDDADARAIGELVQRALAYSKAHPRRDIWDDRCPTKDEREAQDAWEALCRDATGSSGSPYRPGIRICVVALEDTLAIRDSTVADPVELPADAGTEELGDLVLRLLGAARPIDWAVESSGGGFGYKTAWLAVRDSTPEQVADAIGLTDPRSIAWAEGVEASYEDGIFVTPPTSGWVLAVGVGWFGNEPDIASLSAGLATEVQFFATHRVVEAHTSARAVNGRTRRVSYVGDSAELVQYGDATPTEQDLGLDDLDEERAIDLISEDTVMEVAEGWSLNPQRLGAGGDGTHGCLP